MIFQDFAPSPNIPCIVQINYPDGDIGFYLAVNNKDAESSYGGSMIAIFKPKPLTRSVLEDTTQK